MSSLLLKIFVYLLKSIGVDGEFTNLYYFTGDFSNHQTILTIFPPHVDIILPRGKENIVAINLISQHVHDLLSGTIDDRRIRLQRAKVGFPKTPSKPSSPVEGNGLETSTRNNEPTVLVKSEKMNGSKIGKEEVVMVIGRRGDPTRRKNFQKFFDPLKMAEILG